MATLDVGMKVRYSTDPSNIGLITNITGEAARVFINGSERLIPLSELEPASVLTEMLPKDFRVALTRRRLEHPVTDQFLSYKASRTRLLYHQFLPVKKMLESPDQRLLIADEVGTGKTIEAGLIWAELESRTAYGLENVWVVCPKSLVGKWQDEMLQRFDLRLEPLSSEALRQALVSLDRDGVLPPRFSKAVVNLELIRMENNAFRLGQSAIAWDLAIFDEAHHLRNTDTLSHSIADFICQRSKAAVFLTATPLQTHLQDIVHLMEALGVDVAEDPDLLEEQLRLDMQINDWIRTLRHQPPDWQRDIESGLISLDHEGGRNRPGWNEFQQLVSVSDLTDRGQRTTIINSAKDLQILSPYMTRTLRADVDEARPTREAMTRIVEFSPEEKSFYDAVYAICLERALARGIPPGFATQMPERRTSSCVPAVAREILGYAPESEDEESEARFDQAELAALQPLARRVLTLDDAKFEALLKILERAFEELKADRVMIFSTFRGTLRYLQERLLDKGYSLDLMYGPTPARDEDCRRGERSRERIASEFRQGKFQILLASEVAGEGLDFEHCHVLINYDLPWNPMRVEQRIGRCDRLGQVSEKVYIGNLASEGTIEARILTRLYERLEIFKRALGGIEVILGEEIASFERDLFRRGLTQQQQEERLERITQALENNEQNKQAITQSSVISTQGRQLMDSEQQEIKEAEVRFLAPEEIAGFVYSTLERHLPKSLAHTSEDLSFDVIRNDDLRDALRGLLMSYRATHHARTEISRFRNRIGESRRTRVSFLGEREAEEFVHVRHPLLLLARHLEGEPIANIPWCMGGVPPNMVNAPQMLVWAIGSLEGYASQAELLCVSVDCDTEAVKTFPMERAQELVRSMIESHEGNSGVDVERLKDVAEQALMAEFQETARTFNLRDRILTEKAKQAIHSHAQRQVKRNERQLSREDLNPNLRNMFLGWNRRVGEEAKAKLEDIERKGSVQSYLEIVGMAVIHPPSESDTVMS